MDKRQHRIEVIYKQHKDHIYNYIYRMCNDPQLAMDVVQQTFVKVLSKPKVLDVEHLKAYLFTIARNKLHDEWKQKTPVSLDGDDVTVNEFEADSADAADLSLEKQASKSAVVNAIKLLPYNLRELMLLRYTEDLSIAEISDITKRTLTDIKVSLHRARLKFEEKLTAQMYSKVAIARDRCKQLTELLLPYGGNNIPEQQLAAISKHIVKCDSCTKDTAEMKRERQLFTGLPLIPFPIGIDEMLTLLPPSSVSTSEATPSSDNIASTKTNNEPAVTVSTVEKSITTKVVVSTAAIAVLVGSISLFLNTENSPSSTVAPLAQQTSTKSPPPKTKTVSNRNTGSVNLQAKFRNVGKNSPLGADTKWNIYLDSAVKNLSNNKVTDTKTGHSVSFNLVPGKYVAIASLGNVEQKTQFKINKQQTTENALEFDVGLLAIQAVQTSNNNIDVDAIDWNITGSQTSQHTGNKSLYLPPGDYRAVATYPDNLEKIIDLHIISGKKTTINKTLFEYTKVTFNASLQGQAAQTGKIAADELAWTLHRKQADSFTLVGKKYSHQNMYNIESGNYRMQVQLGESVIASKEFTVNSKQSTHDINFKLKAGLLKLAIDLPRANTVLSNDVSWTIYTEKNKKLPIVFSRNNLNPKIYLAEGVYRVTAKAGINASVTRTIRIQSGRTSIPKLFTFELAALQLEAMSELKQTKIDNNIQWLLEQHSEGKGYAELTTLEQSQPKLVLMPGRYRVTAVYANRFKQTYEFTVNTGDIKQYTMLINDDPRPKAWR